VALEGTEDQLAWEARQRSAAAIAAVLAGLLTFAGTVWRGLTLADPPRPGFIESLPRLEDPGPIGPMKSLALQFFEYQDAHTTALVAASVVTAIGYVAFGWALTYLAVATRARRPEFPKVIVYLALIACVSKAIYLVAFEIGQAQSAEHALSGPRTVDAVIDEGLSSLTIFASLVGLPGTLGLALVLVLVSLNAMRVGLLTRFMGVLGIITGALQVLPLIAQPVVQLSWLVMLGVLILGRLPGGRPPAWRTGNAEPWPSSSGAREPRQRAGAGRRGGVPEPDAGEPEPEPASVSAGPSPSASARKRKRKRR
jgi:hypothetical protein